MPEKISSELLDALLEAAHGAYIKTDAYSLTRERRGAMDARVDRRFTGDDRRFTGDDHRFVHDCFEVLLETEYAYSLFLYHRGLRDAVCILRRLGVVQ